MTFWTMSWQKPDAQLAYEEALEMATDVERLKNEKVDRAGDSMVGNLDMGGVHRFCGLPDPDDDVTCAVSKDWIVKHVRNHLWRSYLRLEHDGMQEWREF